MELKEIKKYIKAHKLDSKDRYRQMVDVRGVLYKYLRDKHKMTLTEIGNLFKRDHATVLHSIKRCEDLQGFKDHKENTKHVRAFLRYRVDYTETNFKKELLKCETLIDFHRLQRHVIKGLL